MVQLKKTTKTDLKVKDITVLNGTFYDEGVEINLADILTDAFAGKTFSLAASEKVEEDLSDNISE